MLKEVSALPNYVEQYKIALRILLTAASSQNDAILFNSPWTLGLWSIYYIIPFFLEINLPKCLPQSLTGLFLTSVLSMLL